MAGKRQPYGDVEYADPGLQADGVHRYPIDTQRHVRAAWSFISESHDAALYSPRELLQIKDRIEQAAKRFGITLNVDDGNDMEPDGDADDTMPKRSFDPDGLEIVRFDRTWPVLDLEVVRGGSGQREVTAYAAVFDKPAEIHDRHGHYVETIHRSAFDRAIGRGIDAVSVFYNHGMTAAGTPSDLGSVPIGRPLEIRADGKGLLTRSRLNNTQLADSVLEAIRHGDIKGYSFRGRVHQSMPERVARGRVGGELPAITRTELGLSEYGPTPSPYYPDAHVVAVRGQ
jgi:HK97 family phage prohead protease